jgi:NAD(P)-dependent dehydrogenase (short-subunit alcohol dehydrogenase family)
MLFLTLTKKMLGYPPIRLAFIPLIVRYQQTVYPHIRSLSNICIAIHWQQFATIATNQTQERMMTTQFNQPKIALITGASRGLGKNMALHLAKDGVDLILTYQHNAADAQAVVAAAEKLGRKAVALQLDVSQSATFPDFAAQVQQALQQHWQRTTFDFLVNNAGIGLHVPMTETSVEQFDLLMNIHVKGPFFLTQQLLPQLADGGRIVNVSTGLTRFAIPGYGAYAMMKGAVETMTKYWAKELGARGIRVNVLAPGAIETDFGGGAVRDNESLNQFIASQTALGRAGQPDDIGGALSLLLSEQAGWINAQRIEASGGMFL